MRTVMAERAAQWRGTHRSGGFTIVEVVLALAVLVISILGLFSALLAAQRLRQVNEEKALARNAAQQTLSAIRGLRNIPDAYSRFGGNASGGTFSVTGLREVSGGDPVGRIIIWRTQRSLLNRTSPGQPDVGAPLLTLDEVLEAQTAFSAAYPGPMNTIAHVPGPLPADFDFLDTDLDGDVDHGDDPQLMPVTLRLRWDSRGTVVTQYFSTVIGKR